MTNYLTEDSIAQFREAFETFDLDKDGYLNLKELADLMKQIGYPITDQEVADIINEVDIDGNGHVDFREFIQLLARKMRDAENEDELLEAFKLFDRNGDSSIDFEDMFNIMSIIGKATIGKEITPEEAQEMIDQADLDGDGVLKLNEFLKKILKN